MILPTDIPSRAEIDRLLEHRAPSSVSIYLPTDPASNGDPERIEFKTLAAQASSQLREAGAGVRVIRQFEDEVGYLHDDGGFWRYLARSLAAFAAPDSLITFRLPNRLVSQVEVSDRFYLRPLLRTLTFPHVAFVLALAQGSVRLVEVTPDLAPERIKVDDLPTDVASAAGKSSIADRAPVRRLQGSEGQKVRVRPWIRTRPPGRSPRLGRHGSKFLPRRVTRSALFAASASHPRARTGVCRGSRGCGANGGPGTRDDTPRARGRAASSCLPYR